jgi:hypothetical protein
VIIPPQIARAILPTQPEPIAGRRRRRWRRWRRRLTPRVPQTTSGILIYRNRAS